MQKPAELPFGRFFHELKIRNGLISTDLLSQRTYLGTLSLMCIASEYTVILFRLMALNDGGMDISGTLRFRNENFQFIIL